MSKRILILFGTPIDLSSNLPSNLGDIDRTGPTLARGITYILIDVNLGPKETGLDQEVTLVSRVQGSQSGRVSRRPNEAKGRINRGIRKVNVERGVSGDSVDGEFATRMVFSGRDEGDVGVEGAIRGLDEELGEFNAFVTKHLLFGVIHKGDVDRDGRVLGVENQEFGGSEISNDDVIAGPEVTTVDAESLESPY